MRLSLRINDPEGGWQDTAQNQRSGRPGRPDRRLNVLLVCRYFLSLFDEATADTVVISLSAALV